MGRFKQLLKKVTPWTKSSEKSKNKSTAERSLTDESRLRKRLRKWHKKADPSQDTFNTSVTLVNATGDITPPSSSPHTQRSIQSGLSHWTSGTPLSASTLVQSIVTPRTSPLSRRSRNSSFSATNGVGESLTAVMEVVPIPKDHTNGTLKSLAHQDEEQIGSPSPSPKADVLQIRAENSNELHMQDKDLGSLMAVAELDSKVSSIEDCGSIQTSKRTDSVFIGLDAHIAEELPLSENDLHFVHNNCTSRSDLGDAESWHSAIEFNEQYYKDEISSMQEKHLLEKQDLFSGISSMAQQLESAQRQKTDLRAKLDQKDVEIDVAKRSAQEQSEQLEWLQQFIPLSKDLGRRLNAANTRIEDIVKQYNDREQEVKAERRRAYAILKTADRNLREAEHARDMAEKKLQEIYIEKAKADYICEEAKSAMSSLSIFNPSEVAVSRQAANTEQRRSLLGQIVTALVIAVAGYFLAILVASLASKYCEEDSGGGLALVQMRSRERRGNAASQIKPKLICWNQKSIDQQISFLIGSCEFVNEEFLTPNVVSIWKRYEERYIYLNSTIAIIAEELPEEYEEDIKVENEFDECGQSQFFLLNLNHLFIDKELRETLNYYVQQYDESTGEAIFDRYDAPEELLCLCAQIEAAFQSTETAAQEFVRGGHPVRQQEGPLIDITIFTKDLQEYLLGLAGSVDPGTGEMKMDWSQLEEWLLKFVLYKRSLILGSHGPYPPEFDYDGLDWDFRQRFCPESFDLEDLELESNDEDDEENEKDEDLSNDWDSLFDENPEDVEDEEGDGGNQVDAQADQGTSEPDSGLPDWIEKQIQRGQRLPTPEFSEDDDLQFGRKEAVGQEDEDDEGFEDTSVDDEDEEILFKGRLRGRNANVGITQPSPSPIADGISSDSEVHEIWKQQSTLCKVDIEKDLRKLNQHIQAVHNHPFPTKIELENAYGPSEAEGQINLSRNHGNKLKEKLVGFEPEVPRILYEDGMIIMDL